MTAQYQCINDEFIKPEWGWKFCPYCGAELKARKYMVPERHEVFDLSPKEDKPDRIEVTPSWFN